MNKLKLKRIIIVASFIIIMMTSILKYPSSFASSNANLYLVFDKTTYNVGDIVNININLDQFASLSEVKLQIKIKEEYFEPVMVDNKYFYFSASSVFTNDVINDYVDHTYLRLRLIKDENISEGYFSSYKNNICNLQLKVKRPIDDIYNYFTIDNYDNMGISVYLFDVKDQIINYNLYHREKIKVNWQVESYELNVYSEVPDFKKDIQILNREIGEYEYLIEKQIDTMIIGLKTVHIGIYDKKAADYIVLSKAVSVVDKMAPIITYPSNITIEDNLIMTIDYFDYIDVSDNYDTYLDTTIKYYDEELKEVQDLESFRTYLSSNQKGYLKFIAKDTSKNETSTEFIEINVIDTLAPLINEIDKLVINDTEVDHFDLLSNFIVSDNYDHHPEVVFDFGEYNQYAYEELKEVLKTGTNIHFSYFAIDESMNKTAVFQAVIEVIDTIKPSVKVSDVTVDDVDYNSNDFEQLVIISDNFKYPCRLEKKYYINDVLVNQEQFDEAMLRGQKGYIVYVGIDTFDNRSEEVRQNINVIDTIVPQIIVKNIQNGQKYIKMDKIEYEIVENFDNYELIVLLDDKEYLGGKVEIGKHELYIKVKDAIGHERSLSLDFEVIEDNIIGCKGDASCYVNNYLEVVIIVSALLIFVIIMIIVRIVIKKKKQKIV
ncbi:MAG TPA: hypothetical protein DCR62_05245 [Acholeplasmatales bacterium]|jgi:hypothetical protein|nr:hypothetical protein [Acholeplasmatales bacterium]